MNEKPLAFVIMPFDEEFTPIYAHFIKPIFENAGFSVERADDIESQQNILRDVVEKINACALIIADLTGANPNVFYELGLAHAFRKPVLLITQSVEEVPFDLRSYRLLEYDTHFAKIEKAKENLGNYAKGFLAGRVRFGSPVSDFSQNGASSDQPVEATRDSNKDKDERGYFDHIIDMTNGYEAITGIIDGVGEDLSTLTQSLEYSTEEFGRIGTNASDSSPTAARRVSRELAVRISTFNARLKKANDRYTTILQGTEDSLEFILSFQGELAENSQSDIETFLTTLQNLLSASREGRDSFISLADEMDTLPKLERRLNREVAKGSQEVRIMANNIDRTIASIERALKRYK